MGLGSSLDASIVTPALVVSVLALIFTVGSFWWMNWRKGKLHISPPTAFATVGTSKETLVMEVPFVFFNDGAVPYVVNDLRLVFTDEQSVRPLRFEHTVSKLGFEKDKPYSFVTQFPVRGREAVTVIGRFMRFPGELVWEQRRYPVELQARLDGRDKWKPVCRFTIDLTKSSLKNINQQFSVYHIDEDT